MSRKSEPSLLAGHLRGLNPRGMALVVQADRLHRRSFRHLFGDPMAVRPTTTQAAILVAQRNPSWLTPSTEQPGVGQVLVELQCSGICGLSSVSDGVKGPVLLTPSDGS